MKLNPSCKPQAVRRDALCIKMIRFIERPTVRTMQAVVAAMFIYLRNAKEKLRHEHK